MVGEQKQGPEQVFREGLEAAIDLALALPCQTVPELVEVLKLGLENDGQFRLLFAALNAKGKR